MPHLDAAVLDDEKEPWRPLRGASPPRAQAAGGGAAGQPEAQDTDPERSAAARRADTTSDGKVICVTSSRFTSTKPALSRWRESETLRQPPIHSGRKR